MASDKYLAVIGLGEEDTAHLRLLLRKIAPQLGATWRWGSEENADLVVVDPTVLAGQIARNRAYSSGRRCAVLHPDESLRNGESRLALKADSLAAVLDGISQSGITLGAPVMRANEDFYALDALDGPFEIESDEAASTRAARGEASPAPGLDELLKPDSQASTPQFAVPANLADDTRVQRAGAKPSVRGERRIADSVHGLRRPEARAEGINIAGGMEAEPQPGGSRALRDYLHGNLLGGPSRASIEGAPQLALDPKHRQFIASGELRALTPYVATPLPSSAWHALTTQELSRLQDAAPPRPYAALAWLDALQAADGKLARHLDPGGQFRLAGDPLPDTGFAHHARIIAALANPSKLNEIAATSGAPMADVFSMVSAYDAIGRIEMRGRRPRHDEAKPRGLFAGLRRLLGRR